MFRFVPRIGPWHCFSFDAGKASHSFVMHYPGNFSSSSSTSELELGLGTEDLKLIRFRSAACTIGQRTRRKERASDLLKQRPLCQFLDEGKIGVGEGAHSAKLEFTHFSMLSGLINCIFDGIDINQGCVRISLEPAKFPRVHCGQVGEDR